MKNKFQHTTSLQQEGLSATLLLNTDRIPQAGHVRVGNSLRKPYKLRANREVVTTIVKVYGTTNLKDDLTPWGNRTSDAWKTDPQTACM